MIGNTQGPDYEMTSAARLAYTFTANDRGRLVLDLTTGDTYMVFAAGSGASVMKNITSDQWGYVMIPLASFREVTSGGDVGDTTANGGVLASDTTPIYLGDAAESLAIQWAASNNDIISASTLLPPDVDGTRAVYVDLVTSSGGTTDAASFTVETGWDGGALVSDTATGAAATAAAVATATIAAADIPDAPRRLTIMLTPTAHTTDTKLLHGGVMLRYYKE